MSLFGTLTGQISLTVYCVILALANILVILCFSINRRLRTLANRFVIALAVSDLMISAILVPINIWLPDSPANGPLTAFALLASLGNICGCTYDRFNAIKNPLHYQSIMTKTRFIIVLVIAWTVPIVIALIPQIWLHNAEALNLSPLDVFIYEKRFVAFMTILVLFICLILTAVYVYIFMVAKKHYDAMKKAEMHRPKLEPENEDDGKSKRKERRSSALRNFFKAIKSTALFATIGANFICCWLPLIIVNIAFAFDFMDSLSLVFLKVGAILMYSNSFLNPLAYAFFQKEFRSTIFGLFKKKRHVLPFGNTSYVRSENISTNNRSY